MFGTKLSNGATLIVRETRKRDGATFVLARWGDEFVTWQEDCGGGYCNGHYFPPYAYGDNEVTALLAATHNLVSRLN